MEKKVVSVDPRSGFCEANGIYYSKRDPVQLPPEDVDIDVVTYIFSQPRHSQVAFIDAPTGNTLCYRQLRHNVQTLAAGLHALGIRKGDVVLVLSPNSIMLPCIYLGILSIGAIVTTSNPLSTQFEIQRQVMDSKPTMAFTQSDLVQKLSATQVPIILIQGNNRDEGGQSCVSTLHHLLQSDTNHMPSVKIKQGDTATLLYSSGTTGRSKGVICTHRNYIAAIAEQQAKRQIEGRGREVQLCTMPMYHVFGFCVSIGCVALEATVVSMPKFDLETMLSSIERYRVTVLPAVPPMLIALAKSTVAHKYDLSSLTQVLTGGASLGKEVIHDFTARFPHIQVTQGYGSTEACTVTYTISGEESTHYGSTGLLCSVVEAKMVDSVSGKPQPPNHKGELWLRGPSIMKGYFHDEEATASTLDSEGWLRTGDLCYIDDEGHLFVVDRLKELIKYNAFQVAPAELEELLLSNPEILDAAVIPFPDDKAGQIPMAYVVKRPSSKLSERDVIDFVAKQVAPYKKIRRVAFVNSIPKSPSGKILRRDLIQHAITTSRL